MLPEDQLPIRVPGRTPTGGGRGPERILERWVVDAAHRFGWRCHVERPVTDRRGRTRTAIAGDPGWSDVALVHAGRGLFVVRELKSDVGRVTPDQQAWLDSLVSAGVDAGVWRCRDWPVALDLLSEGRAVPNPGWDRITAKKWVPGS